MRLLLALTAILPLAAAVFKDEAYNIDYHHALLGLPQPKNTFFHPPNPASKASLIFTLSEKSIIGAVNPKDGNVVWRQRLDSAKNASRTLLREGEGVDIVASATDREVAAWAAKDGRLVWRDVFEEAGSIVALRFVDKDVVVLHQGTGPIVQRRDGSTGAVLWEFSDASGDRPYEIAVSGSTIHVTSLHSKILGGLNIKVTDIDGVTGKKLAEHLLSSDSEVKSADDIVFVGGHPTPIVAWSDKALSVLKINILGTKSVSTFPILKSDKVGSISLHAPTRLNSLAHFLVHYQTSDSHWAEVYHIDVSKSTVSKAYGLPKLAGKGTFAVSTSDAQVFFTRVAKGACTVTASQSHGIVERYILKAFAPGVSGDADPTHAISEVLPRPGGRPAVRVAVLLSTGDWALILNGDTAWTRPEALTLGSTAVFAELPQGERLARELAIEEHASISHAYVHRVKRHIQDLERLPEWIKAQPERILAGFTGTDRGSGVATSADKFGFHKLAVVATTNGRLIAIDTASGGKIAWNVQIPDYTERADWQVPTLHASSSGVIRVKNSGGHWVFETTSGKILRHGTDKPKTKTGAVIEYDLTDGQVKGYVSGQKLIPLWTFSPKRGEEIRSLSPRPLDDPVASIGTVLGDRNVLYKYLNPNLVLITAVSNETSVASVYLLDSVSGNVLYEASHTGVDTTRPIASIVSENWLSYSFTAKSGAASPARGYHLVMAALMESSLPNDRGSLGAATNYSTLQPSGADTSLPHAVSQSYQIGEEISHMAVSKTRQGITTRMLLVILPETDSIVGIPINWLDPRRPVGRDPTPNEQAESLMRYGPMLPFSPQWYLNHKREVVGIEKIITSPAILESTSLVFAYGLDVFGTRITPSFSFDVLGKDFNKLQMLATVAVLFVGCLFVAPWVARKQINTRWTM
ncbi:DUF1620-domain-containing protein [Venturia nashicola]|uniref:ER membrane protein complex subunit 1 n=1 Tax=Venturia nashicola TaxID=86259 RepID=A0A4Z1PEW5_9PEZI|nr:DUF1620-domain-containing protein [Venturia nashicola]